MPRRASLLLFLGAVVLCAHAAAAALTDEECMAKHTAAVEQPQVCRDAWANATCTPECLAALNTEPQECLDRLAEIFAVNDPAVGELV